VVALAAARASTARPRSAVRPDNGALRSAVRTAAEWCLTAGRKEGMRDSSPLRVIAWQVARTLSSIIVRARASDRTVRDRAALGSVPMCPVTGSVPMCPVTGSVPMCPVAGSAPAVRSRAGTRSVQTFRRRVAQGNAGQALANGRPYRIGRGKAASVRAARVRGALPIVCRITEKTDRADRVRAGVASVGQMAASAPIDRTAQAKAEAVSVGPTRAIVQTDRIVRGKVAAENAGQTLETGRIGPNVLVKAEVANAGPLRATDPTGQIALMAESAITRTLETARTSAIEITSSTTAIAR
jgi:hypothetical protein